MMRRMAVSAETSYKLTVLSLLGSVAVIVNHAFSLRVDYTAAAGEDWAFLNYFTQTSIKYGLCRVATPFFFCLSGYLLLSGGEPFLRAWWPKLTKRVRTLVLPFLFWSTWSFLVVVALQSLPILRPYFGKQMLIDSSASELAELLLWNPIAHPLWFVRDLFILVGLSPLIYVTMRNRWLGALALGGACAYWFTHYETRYAHGVFYFPLGMYLAIHRPNLSVGPLVKYALVAAWMILIACDSWAIMAGGHIHPLYYPLAILIGLPAAWLLYDNIADRCRTGAVAWLCSLSFFIYVTHVPIVEFVSKGLITAFALDRSQIGLFIAFVLTAVATLAICFAFGHLIRTFLPAVYRLSTGERGLAPIASGDTTAAHPVVRPAAGLAVAPTVPNAVNG
jgi:surface polysaccharide O-acyltransferase-like enzyme